MAYTTRSYPWQWLGQPNVGLLDSLHCRQNSKPGSPIAGGGNFPGGKEQIFPSPKELLEVTILVLLLP